ncbi:MAG TPA: nicotinamide-nucleotide amidohydrolase family protein [Desulfobacteraceae bacterium]|nr:nicotinamide-nucleotide amidohydrolase family protein [Desulfobacteraceae bacterium]
MESDVHVSLTVIGRNQEESETLFNRVDAEIIAILGDTIYGYNQESMAVVVGNLLKKKGWRISVAESCTGGLLASKITEAAGSSEWFSGGVVAYSNDLKQKLLAVDNKLIAEYGAVSAPVARAMVQGIAACSATPIAVSVTGIAGPSGGTEEKPVGTVFFGIFANGGITDHHFTFSGSRREIQEITAQTALDLVRRSLLMHKGVNNGGSNR